MSTSATVWELMARRGSRVVTASDIAAIARSLNLDPKNVVDHLRRLELVLPLFRGFYYVRTPEETRLGLDLHNPLELFAMAAKARPIGNWYFGLNTALRINGMTHEDLRLETVVSDRMYRIRGVPVGRRRFVIHKWAPEMFTFGLTARGRYRYSDPEKTVLDLAYLDLWRARKAKSVLRTWADHVESVDKRRISRYLSHYPPGVGALLEARK